MTYMDTKRGLLQKLKKLETSQRVMERKMLNAKLKDRIRNTIIRHRIRVTDNVQYVTNVKCKWAG